MPQMKVYACVPQPLWMLHDGLMTACSLRMMMWRVSCPSPMKCITNASSGMSK